LQDLENDLENRKLSQYYQNPSLFLLFILLLLHMYVLDAHRYTTCKSHIISTYINIKILHDGSLTPFVAGKDCQLPHHSSICRREMCAVADRLSVADGDFGVSPESEARLVPVGRRGGLPIC